MTINRKIQKTSNQKKKGKKNRRGKRSGEWFKVENRNCTNELPAQIGAIKCVNYSVGRGGTTNFIVFFSPLCSFNRAEMNIFTVSSCFFPTYKSVRTVRKKSCLYVLLLLLYQQSCTYSFISQSKLTEKIGNLKCLFWLQQKSIINSTTDESLLKKNIVENQKESKKKKEKKKRARKNEVN